LIIYDTVRHRLLNHRYSDKEHKSVFNAIAFISVTGSRPMRET